MSSFDIFSNRNGRLRSGWRFLIFVAAFIFLGGAAIAAAQFCLRLYNPKLEFGTAASIAVSSGASFGVAVLFGWLCGKYLENLPFRALGVWLARGWLKDLIGGLIFGALTLAAAVLIAVAFGGLEFDFNRTPETSAIWTTLAVSLGVFIVGAAFEEAFFRGYILQTFARANLAWLSIALTSMFFAVTHLGNDHATLLSTINTALAGIWFSLAYLKTRTLWLPFGLHLMWNWVQGAIFGIEVSGIKFLTTAPLLNEIDAGPIWLTGENYGIEGGIACSVALVISSALIWYLPIFKPTAEMLILTSCENSPAAEIDRSAEKTESF